MSKRLTSPTGKPIRVGPVRPNVGIEYAYQRHLDKLIEEMHASIEAAISATWLRTPPVMATDDAPASSLRDTIGRLAREWGQRFSDFAETTAKAFGRATAAQADHTFAAQLRRAGFTVRFRMTAAVRDVLGATVNEQVSLIKSIPQQYLGDVSGVVMRSVQTGRDLGTLAKELQTTYGVTKRRAATIARDQNNKSTSAITRVRQTELGITHATWLHSAGGRAPREEHVRFSGKTYEIAKGAFLEGKWVWPGTEINCRCVSRSIIPGLD